jgi:beta-lactamase class C
MANFLKLSMGQYPGILNGTDLDPLFQPQVEVRDIFWKWPVSWPFQVADLKSYYGLGWRILEKKGETKKLVFHSGHLIGITSFVGFIPSEELGIVILSNQDAATSEDAGFDFWKLAIETYQSTFRKSD